MSENFGPRNKHTTATIYLSNGILYVKDDTPDSCGGEVKTWKTKDLKWEVDNKSLPGNVDWTVTLYKDQQKKVPLKSSESPFAGGFVKFGSDNVLPKKATIDTTVSGTIELYYYVEVKKGGTTYTLDPKLIIYDEGKYSNDVRARIDRIVDELEGLAELAFDRLELKALREFVDRLKEKID